MSYNNGTFITFEGGEGSGKSTQLKKIAHWLDGQGIDYITTREPGGAPSAEIIRKLLVEGDTDRWQPITEILLHYSARAEHIAHTIGPSLEAGRWVLCDRFADSTLAYQGYGHDFDTQTIAQIHQATVGKLIPDLTLVLDIPVHTGLERAGNRNQGEDRYERMGVDFHDRVRAGFLELAAKNSNRCQVINAEQTMDKVFSDIRTIIEDKLGSRLS